MGSFGESPWQLGPTLSNFSITAPEGQTIESMRLETIWTVTTFLSIPADDFVLTQVDEVPASSPQSALVTIVIVGSLMLFFSLRRARNNEI